MHTHFCLKYLFLTCYILLFHAQLKAQVPSLTYFEVSLSPVYSNPDVFAVDGDSIPDAIATIPDSATMEASFVVAISDPVPSDSLTFTLTDNNGGLVFNQIKTIAAWQTDNAIRNRGNVLYLTVSGGQYPQLTHLAATAMLGNPIAPVSSKVFERN